MRIFRKARGPDTGLRAYKSHYLRVTRHGDVVQAWPRDQPRSATPYDVKRRADWAYAGYWTTWANPKEYITAKFLSKGTDLLPRDILMMAMYGSLYILTDQDGFTYPRFVTVAQDPQLILDQITTQVGAVLYRSLEGWIWVPPGNDGQVLSTFAQTPQWQDVYPVAVETAELVARAAVPGLTGLRILADSASILAEWSTPLQVKLKRAALTGDVTASLDDNATTIANGAVTYAKLQNVSTTKQLLGRASAGAGPVQEIDISQALDWLGTPAQGDVLYRSASGWTPLAAGASGKYLKTNGASADPSWDTPSALLSGGGTPQSPYFNNADIHLCPPTVSGSPLNSLAVVAGTIYFIPFTVPFSRTFTKFGVRVVAGGGIGGSNVRLGIYNVDNTTGGPGTVKLDAGNLSLAAAGYQSLVINQLLTPGPYFFACWHSAANNMTATTNSSTLANVGINLSAGTPTFVAMLSRAAAFGGAFGTESGNTHTLNPGTSNVLCPGLR